MTEKKRRIKVCIGMPVYVYVSPETLQDYMRFAYNLGRRLPQYDFMLAIKSKSEQFRARNGIVNVALQTGCDYLLMMDDDHVIDWHDSQPIQPDEVSEVTSSCYDFPDKMIKHMQADDKLKIVGGLYYHRGGECAPVALNESPDGGYYYLSDADIKNALQEVAITGGGCMMIDMEVFDKIPGPWFQIENKYSTDIQICQLVRDHGYKVACDTSIVVGHVLSNRQVVTPENRLKVILETGKNVRGSRQQIDGSWVINSALQLYKADVMEYGQFKDWQEVCESATRYNERIDKEFDKDGDLTQYYVSRGRDQLARQLWFHFTELMVKAYDGYTQLIDVGKKGYGLDFGCGSAPVSFDYVMRGQKIDFVDIPGTYAYEFTKWRAKHRNVEDRCGWELGGPYDYIFLFDAIEHLKDWRGALNDILGRLRNGGALICNYFDNQDFKNPEHISMNHDEVKKFVVEHSIYPLNLNVWVKREWGLP